MSKDQQEKGNSDGKKRQATSKSGNKSKNKSGDKATSKSSDKATSTKSSSSHASNSHKSTGHGKGSSGSNKSKHSHAKEHSSSSGKSSSSAVSKTSKNSVILKSYKTHGQPSKVATSKETSLTADKSQETNTKTSSRIRSVLMEKSKVVAGAAVSKEKIASKVNVVKDSDNKCPAGETDVMPPVAIVEKNSDAVAQKLVQPNMDKSKEKMMKTGDSNTFLANILSESFRTSRKESVKLKVKQVETNEWSDHGSTFANNVNRDDSAMALVMHTARDEVEIKREETEIFCPGKGDLRSTQPDAQDDNLTKEQP